MSDAFLERLSQFTPNAGALDRDALLFAAGRASARPNRGLIMLATLLTTTQVLSLVLVLPRPGPPADSVMVAAAPRFPASSTRLPESAPPSPNTTTWSTRHRLPDSKTDSPAADSVSLIDGTPPLRAFGPLPPSLLN